MPLPPRGQTLLKLLREISSDTITHCSINAPLLELHDPQNLKKLIAALGTTTRLVSVSIVNTPICIMYELISCLNSRPTIKRAEITIKGNSTKMEEGELLQLASVLNNGWLKTIRLVFASPIQTSLSIRALKPVSNIMGIAIAQSSFGDTVEEAVKLFQDDLSLPPGIRTLALPRNNLNDNYAEVLGVLLQRNRSLLALNLAENMIGARGLKLLRLQVETYQLTTIIEGLEYKRQELEYGEELLGLQTAILANNHAITQTTVDQALEEINKLASPFPLVLGGILYGYLQNPLIEDFQSQVVELQRVFTRTVLDDSHVPERARELVFTYLYGDQHNSSHDDELSRPKMTTSLRRRDT